jgi:predicted MFS family arabinose efflux permease
MASAFTLTLAYLGEHCSSTDAAAAFAAFVTGNVASNLFGRLMSAALTDHLGLTTNFFAFAGLNVGGALLVYVTLDRAPPMQSPLARPGTIVTALAAHLTNRALVAAFAIGFCILFAFIGTFTYVNFVLVRPPIGIGMMALGFVYFVFLPSMVTTPAAGRFARQFGVRRTIRGALAAAAMGLPLLLAPNLPVIIAGLTLVGIGTFFAQAAATGFVSTAATSNRGAASGLYLAGYFGGGLIGSAVLGQVFDRLGWPVCVAAIGLALAAAALLATRLDIHSDEPDVGGQIVGAGRVGGSDWSTQLYAFALLAHPRRIAYRFMQQGNGEAAAAARLPHFEEVWGKLSRAGASFRRRRSR